MISLPVFIPDGFSTTGYICEIPRLHGAVRFKYRIYLSQARAEIITQISKATPKEGEKFAAMAVAKNLLSWDVQNGDGKDLEITAEHVLKLHPKVAHRLYRIVMADEPPDSEPGQEDETPGEDPETAFAAALNGESYEEAREKNLSVV